MTSHLHLLTDHITFTIVVVICIILLVCWIICFPGEDETPEEILPLTIDTNIIDYHTD